MGVYRGGYRQFDGRLLPISTRFSVIHSTEFLRLWRSKWNRRLVMAAAVPLIVVVAVLVGKGMVESQVGTLPVQLNLLDKLLRVEMLLLAILGAAAGSGILADDARCR